MTLETLLDIILFALTSVGLFLLYYFYIKFWKPARTLKVELASINHRLRFERDTYKKIPKEKDSEYPWHEAPHVPEKIAEKIMTEEPFRHLWSEYRETLHAKEHIIEGESTPYVWRATIPAEMIFSTRAIVDTRLKTEFFKHLPGLFTGIGIIGTFAGLIIGLQIFSPEQIDPDQLRFSLKHLLGSVANAFIVSVIAISFAMLTTFLEKINVNHLYAQVEELCQLIDSLYDAGIGEEYLSRLVEASEESATQTTQLKDSLVSDLKTMMTNLVDRQIRETQVSHQAMAASISQSISANLKEPMEEISKIVGQASANQSTSVQSALSDVIAGFMAKLEEVFGGQIASLNSLMQDTASSMKDTRDKFAELAEQLSTAGQNAGEAMGKQLARSMELAELRQQEMNEQMKRFVGEIRELVSNSQSQTSQKLNATLESLGSQVTQIIGGISDQQAQARLEANERQEAMASHTQDFMSGLGENLNNLSNQMSEMTQTMRETISEIRNVTTSSIDKMNTGAEALSIAATDFSQAGQSVQGVFERATQVTEQLTVMTSGLGAAAKSLDNMVTGYDTTRRDMTTLMKEMQTMIESAKQEANVSQELVNQLQSAVSSFNDIQSQTGTYLEQVNKVLTESYESYAENIRKTLSSSRTHFDESLSNAVKLLGSTISELETTIEQLDESLSRLRSSK